MKKSEGNKFVSSLSSKGQIVVPKPFREKLGWKEGDFVGILLLGDIVAMKKIEAPTKEIEQKIKKQGAGFGFEELLYPEK